MKTKNNKYRILVLSDLRKSSEKLLKNTIVLAKMVDADIDFFSVKKPLDVNVSESQLSTMRTLSDDYKKMERTIQNIIDPFDNEDSINISRSFVVGNVKNEIFDHIKRTNPDIIVLGKKKSKRVSIIGDKVIENIIKRYKGSVLILSDGSNLNPNKKLNLGILNAEIESFQKTELEGLFKQTEKPYKYFVTSNNKINNETKEDVVKYVFNESGGTTVSTLLNYIKKSRVDILCCNKLERNKVIINAIDVPVLIKNH